MKRIHRNLFFIALSAGIVSFTSCKENKETSTETSAETSHEEMEMSHDEEMGEESAMEMSEAEFNDEKVAANYEAYLDLKDALVATDAEAAQKAAKKLSENTEAEIMDAANKIAEASDIEAQRKAFSELTAMMEPVLENAIASGAIYKQFCPMAFEGKGDYWFASSEEINNPYFGDKMLHCGRVEKTIQ